MFFLAYATKSNRLCEVSKSHCQHRPGRKYGKYHRKQSTNSRCCLLLLKCRLHGIHLLAGKLSVPWTGYITLDDILINRQHTNAQTLQVISNSVLLCGRCGAQSARDSTVLGATSLPGYTRGSLSHGRRSDNND